MMQLFHITEYQYLIQLKRKYSWQEFQKKARVTPGTYSENFARGIYSSVFEYSINLVEEYKGYYEMEYDNIHQFLFWRYGVSEEILEQIPANSIGYLASVTLETRIDEDEILNESIRHLLSDLE